jgi:hypothetical protein
MTSGTFEIFAPVRLSSGICLTGEGEATVLRKCDGIRSEFALDADYGELKATVADAGGFAPGMGIQIYDEQQRGGWAVSTAVVTAVDSNTLYFDEYLVRDYRADHGGLVSNACSIVAAVEAENVRLRRFVVDGNKENNEYLNGCRGGAIYLHKTKESVVEDLIVRDFAGDGISWQLTENITVRRNEIYGCTHSGLHPGTGSPNSVIELNNSHHNGTDGLFICWRVRNAIIRENEFHHNHRFGLCNGHKDTGILFDRNKIYENGEDGVHFRGERPSNAPHACTFVNNVVENNGTEEGGNGLSFNSPARGIVLENNIIRNTGTGKQKTAVYIHKNGLSVTMRNNRISGHERNGIVYEKGHVDSP